MRCGLPVWLLMAMALTALARGERPPFFAMAYGMQDRDPGWQVEWLDQAGYDGIAMHVWNDELLENLKRVVASDVVQSGQFRVFGIYFPYDRANPQHRELASAAIKIGAEVGAPLWITFKPVDAPRPEVVRLLRELCAEAEESGSEVVLYPHDMTWCLDAEDSLELLAAVDRPNLFTSLHLHQELRAGNVARLDEVIARAISHTRLVSISGTLDPSAVTPGSRDWSDVVRPLADSVYPVAGFVQRLRSAGYEGPIGLQNWRLAGDPIEQHVAALAWWRNLPSE